jgi:hypothetical protein
LTQSGRELVRAPRHRRGCGCMVNGSVPPRLLSVSVLGALRSIEFWRSIEVTPPRVDVRVWVQSSHHEAAFRCPLMTQTGHARIGA